jgi:parallel beta-helix repeat protein
VLISADGTLAGNADTNVPTEKAVKTYADLKLAKASNLSDVGNAATAFGNIKQAATDAATGVVELATDAEALAGTSDSVVTTPGNIRYALENLYVCKYSRDYDSLAAFVTAIGSTECHLVIDRDEAVDANTTIPATVTVEARQGCIVTVASGMTLTINGPFEAGLYKVFAGSGTVAFGSAAVEYARPEWWTTNTTPGTTDMTSAITAALASHGHVKLLSGSTYGVTPSLTIPTTTRIFDGNRATIKCLSYVIGTSGVIALARGASNLTIKNVIVNANSQHYRGIISNGGNDKVVIRNNYIYGLVVSDTVEGGSNYSGAGVRLQCFYEASTSYPVTNCQIYDNIIDLPTVTVASGFSMSGIAVYGQHDDIYSGYFVNLNGTFVASLSPFSDIKISHNVVNNGTHGIQLAYGGSKSSVVDNTLYAQSHRGIQLSGEVSDFLINSNRIREYGSSAVVLGYGPSYGVISGNMCRTAVEDGEAGINIQLAVNNIHVAGNKVHGPTNYGIYMALALTLNTISGNTVSGFKLAGIALEADWQDTNPAGAPYSRPVYGAPAAGDYWAYGNSGNNRIIGNVIGDPKSGATAAGIILTGTDGPTGTATVNCNSNFVNNNVIAGSTLTHELHVYSETAGNVISNILKGNTFITQTKISMSHPPAQFIDVDGNTYLNYASRNVDPISITGATPDVSLGKFFMCANSGATSITNFTNGRLNQEIVIRFDINTTIVHDNDKIRLKGAANATGDSNKHICLRLVTSTIWYEQWRSF